MYFEKPPSPNRAALNAVKTRLFGHYDQLYHYEGLKEEFKKDISELSVVELEELKEQIIDQADREKNEFSLLVTDETSIHKNSETETKN